MNSDAIKDFLFRHVEKFIFGVLVLLAVFLVYRGFQMPDYLSQQQPDRMEQGANEVRTSIDADHWEEIAAPRLETIDVVARTNESIRPVDPQVYRLSHPWEAKSIDMSVKRQDPVIPAPTELRVTGMIAAIAHKSNNPEYPLKALENAEPIEKAPEPKKAPTRRRGRQSPEEMMMEEMAMMEESMMEPAYMMEEAGMGGMPGMGPSRKINAKLYDQGFRPQGTTANLVPAMGHFIAGVALMPHKKLVTAFEEALQQADGYDPRRDQPVYILFELYRADVTDKSIDQLTDQDWVLRGNSEYYKRLLLRQWAGMAKEIVTGKYRDPVLTTPIPPVLLNHYGSFASHPKIPLGDEDPQSQRRTGVQEVLPTGPITFDAEEDPFASRDRFGTGRRNLGMGGGAGMMGAGMMGPGMMGPGMMGAGGYGARGMVDHPEHKLIRFYDFRDFSGSDKSAPQPGRQYVYRIRTAIEDPNFPEDELAQPRSSALAAEVFQRVQRETANAAKTKRRNSRRWSDYSEPSPMVSLPSTRSAYAGPVVPATIRKMQVDGREVEFIQKPAAGKLVVAQWDKTYQVPVPIIMDVLRGSVVAKKGEFEVPDPLTLVVKKLPDANINSQTVVVDVGGGNPLGISPADNQTEPAVMLLFDADGGLRVVDEVDSQRGYRLYSFADERGE